MANAMTNADVERITFRISLIISEGSIELVVFIDHVNRSERGLISPGPSPAVAPVARGSFVVGPAVLAVILVLFNSAGRRYEADALAVLPVI